MNQARGARREERQAEERNLFLSLFYELQGNRLNLLVLEKRIAMPRVFAVRTGTGIQRAVFDAMVAGPLWRSPHFTDVLPAVERAYREVARLYVSIPPHPPWWALVLAAEMAVAWTAKTPTERAPRDYATAGLVAMGGYAAMTIWEDEAGPRQVRVKRAGWGSKTR